MTNSANPPPARQRDLYEEMPVSITVTDPSLPDNPLVYVNPAFTHLTGYTVEAACGRNCRFLQGKDTDQVPVRELADAIAAETPIAVEILNYTASGKRFLNSLVVTPIKGDTGETCFFLGLQVGWGEELDADVEAEHVRERLQTFTGLVKDTLGSVLNLLRDQAEESRAQSVIDLLGSRLDCLSLLYDNVFQTHESGASDSIRLGAYLSRVCSATHLADKSYNTRVALDLAECTTDLETAASIGLVLSEILSNAYETANPYDDGALIRVTLDGESGGARLTVEDLSDNANSRLLPRGDTVGGKLVEALAPTFKGSFEESVGEGGSKIVLSLGAVRVGA